MRKAYACIGQIAPLTAMLVHTTQLPKPISPIGEASVRHLEHTDRKIEV